MTIETVNWNTTRMPLSVFDIEPGFNVPFSTSIGLNEASTNAGYAPAAVPATAIRAISPRIPLNPEKRLSEISFPIRLSNAGVSTSTRADAIIADMATIISDSPTN